MSIHVSDLKWRRPQTNCSTVIRVKTFVLVLQGVCEIETLIWLKIQPANFST